MQTEPEMSTFSFREVAGKPNIIHTHPLSHTHTHSPTLLCHWSPTRPFLPPKPQLSVFSLRRSKGVNTLMQLQTAAVIIPVILYSRPAHGALWPSPDLCHVGTCGPQRTRRLGVLQHLSDTPSGLHKDRLTHTWKGKSECGGLLSFVKGLILFPSV